VLLAGLGMAYVGFETIEGDRIYFVSAGIMIYGAYNVCRAFILFWK